MRHSITSAALLAVALCGAEISPAFAAEAVQDDESKALDSTATQWSFQFAYQSLDYKTDLVSTGVRPAGLDNFVQLRVVAPVPLESLTILPP